MDPPISEAELWPHPDEEAFLRRFVVAERRPRYLALAASRKRRRDLVGRLAHCADLDPRWVLPVRGAEQFAPNLERRLRALGAPATCWVISEDREIDRTRRPLCDALDSVLGFGRGTVLCCVPGALAYHEGEGPEDRRVLLRTDRR